MNLTNRPLTKLEIRELKLANPMGFEVKTKYPNRRQRRAFLSKKKFKGSTLNNKGKAVRYNDIRSTPY